MHVTHLKRTALVALAAAFLGACATPPPPPPPPGQMTGDEGAVLGTVDGNPVTEAMLDAVIQAASPSQREQAAERKAEMVQTLVVRDLLYRKALADKLQDDPVVKNAIAMAARDVLGASVLARKADAAVTEEALKAEYDKQVLRFGQPEAHVFHVMHPRDDVAMQIAEAIRGGRPFSDVAREAAVVPEERQRGGDYGWRTQAPLPEFEEAFRTAAVGEVIGPVKSNYGFHVLQITERRDKVPFEEARKELAEELWVKAASGYREELRGAAKIDIPAEGAATTDTPPAPGDTPVPTDEAPPAPAETTP